MMSRRECQSRDSCREAPAGSPATLPRPFFPSEGLRLPWAQANGQSGLSAASPRFGGAETLCGGGLGSTGRAPPPGGAGQGARKMRWRRQGGLCLAGAASQESRRRQQVPRGGGAPGGRGRGGSLGPAPPLPPAGAAASILEVGSGRSAVQQPRRSLPRSASPLLPSRAALRRGGGRSVLVPQELPLRHIGNWGAIFFWTSPGYCLGGMLGGVRPPLPFEARAALSAPRASLARRWAALPLPGSAGGGDGASEYVWSASASLLGRPVGPRDLL